MNVFLNAILQRVIFGAIGIYLTILAIYKPEKAIGWVIYHLDEYRNKS